MPRRPLRGAVAASLLLLALAASAQDDKRAEARTYFETGIAHFDRGEWSAALASFLRSRALFPTRSATKNAAVCLRHEARYDEALELNEALLRDFGDLALADKTFAEKEIEGLRTVVGSVEIAGAEPGASIVVDGRARGAYPPAAPLRVSAGSHVVRVFKEGFVPFERRVDVASRQVVVVEAKLPALTQSGRLSVTAAQAGGTSLDVVVDNVVVGKTPWEGTVATGAHTVELRGEGDLGTQPATTAVQQGTLTTLSLAVEQLTSGLRVVPVPAGATVSIDAVVVGEGVWEGKLRDGSHRIEVAAEGFLPSRQALRLTRGERSSLTIPLERDLSSPLWRRAHPARVYVEAQVGPVLGLAYGGDVRGCSSCSHDVPLGVAVTARGGYQTSGNVLLGLDVGWLIVAAGVDQRATSVLPRGLAANSGTADDAIGIRGIRFGPSVGIQVGEALPLTLRFGAGAFVAQAVDTRRGTFTTSGGTPYSVDVAELVPATYLYLAPEARVAKRLGAQLEIGAGVSVLALIALNQPRWRNDQPVLAAPQGKQGDGVGTFAHETTAGSFLLNVVPGVDLRYLF